MAFERALEENIIGLSENIEDRHFLRSYSRNWCHRYDCRLTIMIQPNYRFTNEQLEILGQIANENENLYGECSFVVWYDGFLVRYPECNRWLRTYKVEEHPLTFTQRAILRVTESHAWQDNIAVVEIRFNRELDMDMGVLRFSLINQYGELQTENFELALQLQQIMLGELAENKSEERPFEQAREIMVELGACESILNWDTL